LGRFTLYSRFGLYRGFNDFGRTAVYGSAKRFAQ
jgi:hypothetical protein